LTEEQKKDLENQGISVEQYLEGQGDDFEDIEEEGEEDQYGDEGYGSEEGDEESAQDGAPVKRAKKDE